MRIGIIGAGTIGKTIIRDLQRRGDVAIDFVLVRETARADWLDLPPATFISDESEALARGVDLIVETAMPELVARLAPRALERSDFCAFSGTALADAAVERAIRDAAAASGRRFFVPHGAVLALDGLEDGRELLQSVTITTTKSGKSLGLDPDAQGLVFEGTAREACKRFPRNVNVHAAIALAGIGLDRTVSRIVAVPGQQENEHRIEIRGEGLEWTLEIASRSLGGVTGSYTPHSAAGSVRRILGGSGIRMA
ncbi:aspartate dehydrogenase domain-containing protein [Paracoccus sp. TOH]|uniref:aspartate dehydrogenase domain-containing protein n=1 Tax=Paracoccus sp. TOH TaxID=1263728 RepID=UPI0025AEFFE3|nr:aspartate dehydrogenase domain-containing protein [Paracoccus sp. TOH]WJS85908.1 DUF108 domain-containing protein [Paracoccus sp. TOH]